MSKLCDTCGKKRYCFRTSYNIETMSCSRYISVDKWVYRNMVNSLYGINPKPVTWHHSEDSMIGKVNNMVTNMNGMIIDVSSNPDTLFPYNRIADFMKKEDERVSNMIAMKFGSPIMQRPKIKKVHFNPPATVVLWTDGTKTVVKCQHDEQYDPEKGLAMAIAKKTFGNKGNYFNKIKEWTEPYHKAEMEAEEALRKVVASAGCSSNTFSALAKALKGLKPDGN